MDFRTTNWAAKKSNGIKYAVLVVIGTCIILFGSLLQHAAPPLEGEYYYSSFLRNNYTWFLNVLFFITGLLIGYFLKLNPWYSGICLLAVYPLTSVIEATVYRGSHNLIPFEFAVYFLMMLPTILAVYLGKFARRKPVNRRS